MEKRATVETTKPYKTLAQSLSSIFKTPPHTTYVAFSEGIDFLRFTDLRISLEGHAENMRP
ncbi:hypothetical protein CCP3SC1_160044 [Gammaproteobacteria bacterium]